MSYDNFITEQNQYFNARDSKMEEIFQILECPDIVGAVA